MNSRITSKNTCRYNSPKMVGWKKLQFIEDILERHNIKTTELEAFLGGCEVPKIQSVIPRFHWKHKTKYGDEYCGMCDCTHVLYYSVNYADYYCSQCGRPIDWDSFLKEHKEDDDTRKALKRIAKLVEEEIKIKEEKC